MNYVAAEAFGLGRGKARPPVGPFGAKGKPCKNTDWCFCLQSISRIWLQGMKNGLEMQDMTEV